MQTGGGITRKRRRIQRLLYWVMALLGTYILGKGGGFVLDRPAVQEAMARQEAKRRLEDMVIRTLMPGYTAAVQGWTVNWSRRGCWSRRCRCMGIWRLRLCRRRERPGQMRLWKSGRQYQRSRRHSEEPEHSEETEHSEEPEHSEETEYSQEPELPQETAPGEAAGEGQKTIQRISPPGKL